MENIPNLSELESTKKTVKFFEGLLRSTPNGIVVTDASQNIVLVNGRFSSIFQNIGEMLLRQTCLSGFNNLIVEP